MPELLETGEGLKHISETLLPKDEQAQTQLPHSLKALEKKEAFLWIFRWKNIRSDLPCLILTAGLVCGVSGEWLEVVFLGVLYILILAITAKQMQNSVCQQAELKSKRTHGTDTSPGQHTEPRELQVNDQLSIHPGDMLPADISLIEGCCTVDPSYVTGVKSLVTKYQGDKLYQDNVVLEGNGQGIVVAVGKDTFVRKNANPVTSEPVSSIEKLDLRFMWPINIASWTVLFFLAIIQFKSSEDISSVLILLVSLSLVSSTSFFNIICKTLVSKGTNILLKWKAVPVDLDQIEKLAHLDTLCIDKELFVLENYPQTQSIWLYNQDSAFELYRAASLTPRVDKGPYSFEKFLCDYLSQNQYPLSQYQVIDEREYSPDLKCSTVTIRQVWDNQEILCVKGLPGIVLALCKDPVAESKVKEKIQESSQANLNWVAVASRTQTGWCFHGLIPYQMTLAEITVALHYAEDINLHVIRLADWPQSVHKALAAGIGMQVDKVYPSEVLPEPNSDALILEAEGFSGLTPQDRFRIVTSLRRQNKHVAMVCTDISDYPTFLAHLDVAIALPSSVPALKEKSHLLMTSQSLEDVVTAISQAKRTWTAVQRCCVYFFVCNSQILVFFLVASVTVSGYEFTSWKNIPELFFMPGLSLIIIAVLKTALQYSVLSSQLPLVADCRFELWKEVLMAVLLCGVGVSTSVIVLLVTLGNVEFDSLDWIVYEDWEYGKVQTAVWLKLALSEVFTLLAFHISWRNAWESTKAKVWLYYLTLILPLLIAYVSSPLLPKDLQFLEVLFVFLLSFLSFLCQLLVQYVINRYFSLLLSVEALEAREESGKRSSHPESSYPPFKDCMKRDKLVSKRDRRKASELNRAT